MKLLFMVAMLLLAGLVIGALLHGRPSRTALIAGLVVLAAGATGFQVAGNYWQHMTGLRDQRRSNDTVTAGEAGVRAGLQAGFNVDFLRWAEEQMRPGESYFFPPDNLATDNAPYQWATYQLLPHLVTGSEDADVYLFYNQEHEQLDWPRRRFSEAISFAPGFGFARREGGSG